MRNRINKKSLLKFLGIIIFILILVFKVDFKNLYYTAIDINPCYLAIVIISLLISSVFNPYRWQYILKLLKVNYSFKKIYTFFYLATCLGIVTPAKTGEVLGKVFYLKKEGCSFGKSIISIIIEKLLDIFFLLIIGLVSIFYLPVSEDIKNNILIFLGIGGLFLLIILLKKKSFWFFFKKIFMMMVPQKFRENWPLYLQSLINYIKVIRIKNYFYLILTSIVLWLIHFLVLYILAIGVGIKTMPFFYLSAAVAVSQIVAQLPISIAGIGTREATLLFFFSFFNITPELTISFSILSNLLAIFVVLILGALVALPSQKATVSATHNSFEI